VTILSCLCASELYVQTTGIDPRVTEWRRQCSLCVSPLKESRGERAEEAASLIVVALSLILSRRLRACSGKPHVSNGCVDGRAALVSPAALSAPSRDLSRSLQCLGADAGRIATRAANPLSTRWSRQSASTLRAGTPSGHSQRRLLRVHPRD